MEDADLAFSSVRELSRTGSSPQQYRYQDSQEGGHRARCRKPIWWIPSVRLLLTPQLCEQIVGRLDIAEGHQKLAQRVIVQRIRLVGVTV